MIYLFFIWFILYYIYGFHLFIKYFHGKWDNHFYYEPIVLNIIHDIYANKELE